jgi:acyl carrier protein
MLLTGKQNSGGKFFMTFEKVKKMLAEQLNIDEDTIKIDSDIINDLKADSLDVFQMLMSLEEEFNITVPDDKAQELRKVSDIVNYIDSQSK